MTDTVPSSQQEHVDSDLLWQIVNLIDKVRDTKSATELHSLIQKCGTANPSLGDILPAGYMYEITLLHQAVNTGRPFAVEVLLREGADRTAKNKNGLTPIELARDRLEREKQNGPGASWATWQPNEQDRSRIIELLEPKKNLLKRIFGAKKQNQAAQTQSSSAAKKWFKDPSQRNGPLSPSDFNLFEAPSYTLKKWAKAVSSEPWRVHCSVVKIENLGVTTRTLFDILKQRYDLTSLEAVDIFNNYLGTACPKCFGGLTGELLQTIETSKNAVGAVLLGGDPGLQRILNGTCANCSSKEFYVVWHGDKKYS